jgi:hypothetical protein
MGIIPPVRIMTIEERSKLNREERFAAVTDDLMKCTAVLRSKTLEILTEEVRLLGESDD